MLVYFLNSCSAAELLRAPRGILRLSDLKSTSKISFEIHLSIYAITASCMHTRCNLGAAPLMAEAAVKLYCRGNHDLPHVDVCKCCERFLALLENLSSRYEDISKMI